MGTAPAELQVTRLQRMLLPGEVFAPASGHRSPRDRVVDLTIWLIALGIGTAVIADSWDLHSDLGKGLDLAAGTIALVALGWRRRQPFGVAILGALLSIGSGFAGGAVLASTFNIALRGTTRQILAVASASIPAAIVYSLIYQRGGRFPWEDIAIGVLLTVLVFGWGLFVRARRDLIVSLRDRAERLEAEQRLRIDQAREAERRRIAREMHDVLAHRISLLSVHAGALEFRPDAPPEEIAAAAGVVRATARTALEDLRNVVGLLREGPVADTPEPPQPTIADVPALVEESRAAGARVRSRVMIDADVPEVLGRSAYRIVQEGLTNARKHAPGAAVELRVATTPGPELVIEVRNPRAIRDAGVPSGGIGLIGLAERVALVGGRLEHGTGDDGEFALRAWLPWTPAT